MINDARAITPAARVWLRVVAAAAAIALASCSKEEAPKAAAAATTPLDVAVKRVEPQKVPIVLEAVGQAEGSRDVEVRARVSGILERRMYTEGGPVQAGQILFEIDPKPFEIAVDQARASLAQERAREENARREADRLKALADTKAISQREYDQAVSTEKEATAAIQLAHAKLAEAELNLSYTRLKAPISGVTSRAVRSEGSLIVANTDLLTTVTQVDPIWVRFSLAEPDYNRIRGNDRDAKVDLVLSNGTIGAGNGRLNFTGSTVDPKLGTVQLRAEFANRGEKWLPGQFVKVRIAAGTQDAFLVPQAAVSQSEQARSVWVVGADGKATQRTVQTANWLGNDWIVTSGLQPGDQVIVDNLIKLRPGVTVQARVADASQQAANAPAAPARAATSSSPR